MKTDQKARVLYFKDEKPSIPDANNLQDALAKTTVYVLDSVTVDNLPQPRYVGVTGWRRWLIKLIMRRV